MLRKNEDGDAPKQTLVEQARKYWPVQEASPQDEADWVTGRMGKRPKNTSVSEVWLDDVDRLCGTPRWTSFVQAQRV